MIRGQRGFTLIENLMAAVIGVVAILIFSGGIYYMKKASGQVQNENVEEKQVSQIIENVRTGIQNYQITFDDSAAAREAKLDVKSLPMAWSNQLIAKAADCSSCPGRFGFIIQPFPSMRGLYTVTVRMTYKDWTQPYRDYQFVVSTR